MKSISVHQACVLEWKRTQVTKAQAVPLQLRVLPTLCGAACRSDGLAQQFLTNLAKLKAAKDCVLGLAATLSLWYLTADDANPCFLASTAAAVLLDQLLQVRCRGWHHRHCWLVFRPSASGA